MAVDLLEIAGRYFGIGLAAVVGLLNPQRIVIGGGLARIGPLLLDPCMQSLHENIDPVLADTVQVVPSELWDRAGMLGAGMLVWEPCP
jgi:glucokinase